MNHHYRGLFENWEIGVAKNVIREFKSNWKCLRIEDDEDLLQECLIQWLFAKDKYDSTKEASINTFMAKVVRNRLQNIVKEYNCDKRKYLHDSISLDSPLNEDEDSSSLHDLVPDSKDYQFQANLKLTISQVILDLTPKQKALCDLLAEGCSNMNELSESLEIERTTVYREIKRIREVFESKGLKTFLK
jgi:RNA polymerase sigma factor (sigma-70 family)